MKMMQLQHTLTGLTERKTLFLNQTNQQSNVHRDYMATTRGQETYPARYLDCTNIII